MAAASITSVGQALEDLVHQFADPWAFLRELVQNSIDAGTGHVEVTIRHDERGVMAIEVADSGEGMTREIIDTRLTRLFASSKEGDYTKIGRFGIGFVSVFAIDPELVSIDTGRAGEWWRVVFRRDRSFERIRLSTPVEGTTVRLYRRASAAEVEEARRRARAALTRWCRHARVDIRLEGELISGPLDIEGVCRVEHREEGTHLVMAIVPESSPLRGYYHGGLTLHEEVEATPSHVSFKIDSRFLEHTLTRDDVIRDENFDKALAIAEEVARTRLPPLVFAELERRTCAPEGEAWVVPALRAAAAARLRAGARDPELLARKIVPLVGAAPISLAAARGRRRGRRRLRARAASRLTELLLAEGHVVVACAADDDLVALLQAALAAAPAPVEDLCTASPLPPDELAAWAPLRAALAALLKAGGLKLREVTVGRLDYPDSRVAGRAAITQAEPFSLTKLREIDELGGGWLTSGRALVLAADHPTLRRLRRVATHEPELAAYLALKSFFLHGELSPALDDRLATAAAEARWRRTG